eukprot:TRINITY_DN24483_c0_g1_i1.p1 TRINITY_DN24483_c0_g1~~TRINITY_DN24483_c0_g1_i1.p1  ORF type:complete len:279 (+),score=55.00 TRINITY_DN24483_c0_g1_i1:94-930(+)
MAAAAGGAARSVRLSNGVEMPLLGFGLSHNQGGFDRDAVMAAIAAGVRHFDTAKRYGTEEALGEAIRASGVPRSEFFLTSKLWPDDAGNVQGAYRDSCRRIGVERLDLYLCHWPGVGGDAARLAMWRGMEQLLSEGQVRAIGVSNFLEKHLRPLIASCTVRPMVNQIEFNPFQHPAALVDYCRSQDIVVEGYCPLGKGRVLGHQRLAAIAAQLGCSPALVLLRWSLQKGVPTICKTRDPAHAVENTKALDLCLPAEVMGEMDTWHENMRVTWDPTDVP